MASSRKVRGRTSPGRLRGLDAYLLGPRRALLASPGGLFVDFGFGERPDTTLELADAILPLNPSARIVGVEHEPYRVAAAAAQARPEVAFVLGGFEEVKALGERPRLVRAMNVLRGYRPEELPALRGTLRCALSPDGLLIEGSSDEGGDVLTAHLISPETYLGLLLFTSFTRGFAPWMFRDWLPRELRRSAAPGSAAHALFSRWTNCWEAVRAMPGGRELSTAFQRSAADAGLHCLGEGMALWRDAPPPQFVLSGPVV